MGRNRRRHHPRAVPALGGAARGRSIVYELLEDVGREGGVAVDRVAGALWFGDVRVSPRFPSPLHTRLVR